MTVSYDDVQTDRYWIPSVIKYTLDASFYLSGPSYLSNIDDGDADLFEYASTQWANVTNITFELDDLNAQYGFVKGAFSSSTPHGVNIPEFNYPNDSDVITRSTTVITDDPLIIGDPIKFIAVHEIGHALGLDHPGGGGGSDPDYNQSMTVMSYNRFDINGDGSLMLRATGPMYFDIRAIQEKYGVNTSYQSGNNNYTFDGSQKLLTIWDGGGNDTIDASNDTVGVGIDLRHDSQVVDGSLEHLSAIGETFFYIAYGANIENATGGSGNDYLAGSDPFSVAGYTPSTGNNHLIGNEGEDWIEGNGGSDTIEGGDDADRLFGGDGNDVIYGGDGDDYEISGGDGNDTIYAGDGSDNNVDGGAGNDFIDLGAGDDTANVSFANFSTSNVDTIDGGLGSDVINLGDVFNFGTNEVVLHAMDADNDLIISYGGLDIGGIDDGGHDDNFSYLMNEGDYTVMLTSHQSFSTNTSSYTAASTGGGDIINDDLMLVFGVKNSNYQGAGDIHTMQDLLNCFDDFSVIIIHDVGLGFNYTGSDIFGYLKDHDWTVALGGNTFLISEPVG